MPKHRNRHFEGSQRSGAPCHAARIGMVLLDLHNALRRVEQCRMTLNHLGFARRCWQEIVNDVDPELRFAVRPKLFDAIVERLHRARKPLARDVLTMELAQGRRRVGQVRQSITVNLRRRNLVLYPGNKIGLPEWKK